jgi:hypothetical protein
VGKQIRLTEEATARNALCEVDILMLGPFHLARRASANQPTFGFNYLDSSASREVVPGKLAAGGLIGRSLNPGPYGCGPAAVAMLAGGSSRCRTKASTSPQRCGSHSLWACPGVSTRSYQERASWQCTGVCR